MKVAVLIDVETADAGDPQFVRPKGFDTADMEWSVTRALRALGHEALVAPFESERTVRALRADLVFNLTEHVDGDRGKDWRVAVALERAGLRYTGAGIVGLALCRDKARSKRLLRRAGFDVPGFKVLKVGNASPPGNLRYPVLVKPLLGDASEDISRHSLTLEAGAARKRIAYLHRRTGKPVICEEFVEGRELKLALLGNDRPTLLAPREVRFGDGGPTFITSRVKDDPAYRRRWNITYPKARLSASELRRLNSVSAAMYRLLGMRDYGKIDVRLTPGGKVFFIEGNPNPDLSPGGFGRMASWSGLGYTALIGRIVRLAMARKA